MTSPEAVRRAKSHNWQQINDQTEQCQACALILPKSTDLENVPGCTAINVCPECSRIGEYESRILINGRGYYSCAEGHRWQDLNEKPTVKGTVVR